MHSERASPSRIVVLSLRPEKRSRARADLVSRRPTPQIAGRRAFVWQQHCHLHYCSDSCSRCLFTRMDRGTCFHVVNQCHARYSCECAKVGVPANGAPAPISTQSSPIPSRKLEPAMQTWNTYATPAMPKAYPSGSPASWFARPRDHLATESERRIRQVPGGSIPDLLRGLHTK